MLTYQFRQDQNARMRCVEFGLMSPEEIKRTAVVHVNNVNIYHRGMPHVGGINDHRMGTVDRRLHCGTCGRDVRTCPGHVGCIQLAIPCYHIGFIDTTLKILRSVCFMCSRLKLTDEEVKTTKQEECTGKQLLNHVYGIAKTRRKCPHCKGPQPSYVRIPGGTIRVEWSVAPDDWENEEERQACEGKPFTSIDAASILRHMRDEDCVTLGLNPTVAHPRNMVNDTLLVPPPIARPAIMASEGSRIRGQDDITHKLQDINKRSIELAAFMSNHRVDKYDHATPDFLDKISKLQSDVFALINNSVRGQKQSTQRSGAPTKSLTDRLKGKEGRIRGNLMGKRVNFSARSVITPDAVMDVDQVGVPYAVAMSLTVQERVTPLNIREMRTRVMNGTTDIVGADSVITSDGTVIKLEFCEDRTKIRLQYGWIIERFLKDNDVVIFNRQPSLHKMGMMGHRVVLVQGSTFRLNLCCANPYNADFDGDEMNLHAVQSPCAIAEVASLMAVPLQVISPQANKPVMGIVQDTLLGASLMSHKSVLLDRREALQLLTWIKYPCKSPTLPVPAIAHPIERWTGLQILSLLLPGGMMLRRGGSVSLLPTGKDMLVSHGTFMYATLGKATLGSASNGIIDVMYRDFGPVLAVRFMSDIQRVVNAWLIGQAFAVSISDCVLPYEGQAKVNDHMQHAVQNVASILEEKMPETMANMCESTVMRILGKLLAQAGDVVTKHVPSSNAISSMVSAGSKGNPINLSQICGCVGQQSVEGKRIHAESASRTLSCFGYNSKEIQSNGFVQNSYALGLEPYEYFFHAMGGREGLVDTAVKTATTGYIQRRQMKAMEDNRVMYDGTVRNAQSMILEYSYGSDGYDPVRVEKLDLVPLKYSKQELVTALCHDPPTATQATELAELHRLLVAIREGRRSPIRQMNTVVLLPFNSKRLLQEIELEHHNDLIVGEQEAYDMLSALIVSLRREACSHLCLEAALRFHFSTRALRRLKVTKERLRRLLDVVRDKCETALVTPGESVGSIAAQSIGEPCTQMTLNTFHLAGVGSKNVTLGIPRFKEILDFSRNIRTPCTTVRLKGALARNKEACEQFARTLGRAKLGNVVKHTEALREPSWFETSVEDDRLLLRMDSYVTTPVAGASTWVCRLQLDKNEMKARCLTPPVLCAILKEKLSERAHVLGSETNAVQWIIRIRFLNVHSMIAQGFQSEFQEEMEHMLVQRVCAMLLDQVMVGGHPAVSSATVRDVQMWNDETEAEETIYVIDSLGNFLEQSAVIGSIEWNKTVSNDISEVLETLGVEAAVAVMLHEIETTISFDGTYVDRRHLMMVVNTMTRNGSVMPISRHGINRASTGPLVRCSFEETADVLYDAAIFGEIDDAKGVTQNIMTGQMSNIGTGAFDLLMPDWALPASSSSERKKLVKTKVRMPTPATLGDRNGIEYVDESMWAFRDTRPRAFPIVPPFTEAESMETDPPVEGAHGNRQYAEPPKVVSAGHTRFVPSTPPKVIS